MSALFIGRLDDIGEDGVQLVANMVKIFKQYGLKTENHLRPVSAILTM